jgi:MFS family permease
MRLDSVTQYLLVRNNAKHHAGPRMDDTFKTKATVIVEPVDLTIFGTFGRSMMTGSGLKKLDDGGEEMISMCLDKIGFGRYQRRLFWLCAFAWFNDAFWFTGITFALPQLAEVLILSPSQTSLILIVFYLGCALGEVVWGFIATVYGRIVSFTLTLAMCGLAGGLMGVMPNYGLLLFFSFLTGTAYGGNMSLATVLFLEWSPRAQGSMLSFMMLLFNVGAIVAAALAWGILPLTINWSATDPTYQNAAWRVYFIIMGFITVLMLVIRKVALPVQETPYFLFAQGNTQKTSEVLRFVAAYNGDPIPDYYKFPFEQTDKSDQSTTSSAIEHSNVWSVALEHVTAGFVYFKEMWGYTSTVPLLRKTVMLLFWYWAVLYLGYIMFAGMVSVLVNNLHLGSDANTYRDLFIYSCAAIPTSWLAAWMLDHPKLGRVKTMGISAAFLGLATIAWGGVAVAAGIQGENANVDALAGASIACLVLYNAGLTVVMVSMWLYTPEVVIAKYRTVLLGFAMALGRVASLIAPLVAGLLLEVNSPINNSLPALVGGVIVLIAAGIAFALPIETRPTAGDQNASRMLLEAMRGTSHVPKEWIQTAVSLDIPVLQTA